MEVIVHVKGRTNICIGSCYENPICNLFYYDVYIPDLGLFVIAGSPEALPDYDVAKSYGASWAEWEKAQRFKYLNTIMEEKGYKVVQINYLAEANYDSIMGAAL